jgi:hypothetical protein
MEKVGDENQQPGQGQQQGPTITNDHLKDAVDVECESCGCKVFEEKIMLKKISKFQTGTDRDSISPIPVIACASCNHINEMFIPKI